MLNAMQDYRCSACQEINWEIYDKVKARESIWVCRLNEAKQKSGYCKKCMKLKNEASDQEPHCQTCKARKMRMIDRCP